MRRFLPESRLSFRRSLGPALCLAALALALGSAGARADETTAVGWGFNLFGQVGTGSATKAGCECIGAPQAVVGLSGVTQIAAGREHTLALLSNGTVMAWGADGHGELGDGGTASRGDPALVPGLTGVVAIAAGDDTSMALLADGSVRMWGLNVRGELGQGEHDGPEICPFFQQTLTQDACSKEPISVPGVSNVVAIAMDGPFALALRADGTVLAWGFDGRGGVGDGGPGEPGCECVPRPTVVPGVSGAMAISAGESDGSALLADGTVANWGSNRAGGLGTGGTQAPPAPCCLGPVPLKGVGGVRTIAVGSEFGLAALASGAAMSWGSNEHGELGNGAATPEAQNPCKCVPTPGSASLPPGVQSLAAGERHGLALLPDGGVMSWGDNRAGQVGTGAADEVPHPSPVGLGLTGASAIAAGAEDSFALIGATHALSVALAGAGAGVVGGAGVLCPPSCGSRFPAGQVAILRAEGQGQTGFAGFSGACTGTGSCEVKLDRDQAVTATFGVPKGTRIVKARIDSRHGAASFRFGAPGAITGYQCMLVRPRARGKRRLAPRFARCAAAESYRHLAPGRYVFRVRALDSIGPDAHPALRRFGVRG